ncbi:MAG: DNA alkylation repair protein [Candidatus Thorarchaeota archaeon]|nr:DNA alkylation repair protein [Candidatus Thorarchaeota archaeon]
MIEDTAKAIIKGLHSQKDIEKGRMVAKYMKTSRLEFQGVLVPEIRKTARRHIRSVPLESLPSLAQRLWANKIFEPRLAGVEIMELYSKKGDIDTAIATISWMIDRIDTLSLCDPLCIVCLGTLMIRDASVQERIADWRKSDNFWRRRATVLPYVHLGKKTIYRSEYGKMILDGVTYHLSDSNLFVAKAVGWALREYSKKEPEVVREFIEEHKDIMPKLAVREGSKKLK